jgi:hypothetical protein
MPGRKWYVVAALIFVVGFAVFGVFLFLRIRELAKGFQQVVVPGTAEIAVDEPGRWTIYHETGGSIDGTYYGASDLTGLQVVVTSPTGQPLDLVPPGVNESYTIGGRRGVAIFRFQAPEPGTYRLEASFPSGQGGSAGILTVGKGFTWGIVWTVLGAIAIAMASFCLALLIAVVTFVKRYRARRRLAAAPT